MADVIAPGEVPAAVENLDQVPSGLQCRNCGKPASTQTTCPVCFAAGVKESVFCSQECFDDNYKTHKKLHKAVKKKAASQAAKLDDTFDPYEGFEYSGPLRACYPKTAVPKRAVPDHIGLPDYATAKKGVSFAETLAYSARVSKNTKDWNGKILDDKEIQAMRESCILGREVLDIAAAAIRPGISTLEIDKIVHHECMQRNAYPSPLGYHMFPRSVCTSINEVICHGIPDARPLEEGDIVNLDISLFYKGFHSDLNATYPVGKVSTDDERLISAARECLDEAIRVSKPGYAFKDLGKVIEDVARHRGFSVNKTYGGHGINQLFHTRPNISHYEGNKCPGTMKAGMTFTIEPMICVGNQQEMHWPDNWTATTRDGKKSAQFEETMVVTETGVEILTAAPGWTLPPKAEDLA